MSTLTQRKANAANYLNVNYGSEPYLRWVPSKSNLHLIEFKAARAVRMFWGCLTYLNKRTLGRHNSWHNLLIFLEPTCIYCSIDLKQLLNHYMRQPGLAKCENCDSQCQTMHPLFVYCRQKEMKCLSSPIVK